MALRPASVDFMVGVELLDGCWWATAYVQPNSEYNHLQADKLVYEG